MADHRWRGRIVSRYDSASGNPRWLRLITPRGRHVRRDRAALRLPRIRSPRPGDDLPGRACREDRDHHSVVSIDREPNGQQWTTVDGKNPDRRPTGTKDRATRTDPREG